jgi:hypothetical protein
MLARRLTTILPEMTLPEAIDTTRIPRVSGLTGDRTVFVTTRLLRVLHHILVEVWLSGSEQIRMSGDPAGTLRKPHANTSSPSLIVVSSRSSRRVYRVPHAQREGSLWVVPAMDHWPRDPMDGRCGWTRGDDVLACRLDDIKKRHVMRFCHGNGLLCNGFTVVRLHISHY